MNDDQLLRYSRQIFLPQVGAEGQSRLLNARALIIGAGGLGSPVAMYLAAAGVGHLMIADFDDVDLSNLQRQIVHGTEDIGRAKVDSAADRLRDINPEVQITTFNKSLTGEDLAETVAWADVVIDCSDNFTTRFAVNGATVKHRTPLVSGAVIRMEGQITTFLNNAQSPCYHCLYKDEEEAAETCSESGILAPVAGIIGSMQATEALKVLLEMPTLCGRLLVLDALHMEWRSLKLRKDPECPVCGKG